MPVFSQSIQPLRHCQCLQCCINIFFMPSCCRLFTNTDLSSALIRPKSFNASVHTSISLNQRFSCGIWMMCHKGKIQHPHIGVKKRCNTSGMWCCVVRWVVPDISKEQCAFIFRVRQLCSRWGTVILWNNSSHLHNDTSSYPRKPQPSTNLPVVCKPDTDSTTLRLTVRPDSTTLRLTVRPKFQCGWLQH